MDKGGPSGGPIMDVSFPGSTAATPSSKPVVPAQPLQADPMMTPRPSLLNSTPAAATPAPVQVPTPPAPVQVIPQEQAPDPTMNVKKVEGHEIATPLHKLTNDEPIFGHVGKHKKNKFVIFLIVFLLVGAAAAVYLFLFKAK